MATRYVLHTAVSAETKRRVRAAAAEELITPSAWLRRVAIRALAHQPSARERRMLDERTVDPRDYRFSVRVSHEDALLLKARALARGIWPATYISVLVRSHLRSLSPLPKEELLALKRAVSELGALTRDLHRIAHALGNGGRGAPPEHQDLRAVAQLCEVLRSDTKALIKANVNSWELGHPATASRSRH